jgi:hypothetical protein
MKLIHHKSCNVKNYSVNLAAQVQNRSLIIEFSVESASGLWHKVPAGRFNQTQPAYNWLLWNYDVVEVFLQKRTHGSLDPYMEFQATPTGEELVLEIYRPRVQYACPLVANNLFSHQQQGHRWTATFHSKLDTEIEHYYIGAFACLGQDAREYLSLNPNPEMQPDYHRPELFLPLRQIL